MYDKFCVLKVYLQREKGINLPLSSYHSIEWLRV
jgi:hypothetical protein